MCTISSMDESSREGQSIPEQHLQTPTEASRKFLESGKAKVADLITGGLAGGAIMSYMQGNKGLAYTFAGLWGAELGSKIIRAINKRNE